MGRLIRPSRGLPKLRSRACCWSDLLELRPAGGRRCVTGAGKRCSPTPDPLFGVRADMRIAFLALCIELLGAGGRHACSGRPPRV